MATIRNVVVVEPVCRKAEHAAFNASLLEVCHAAVPDTRLCFLASQDHWEEVAELLSGSASRAVLFEPLSVPERFASVGFADEWDLIDHVVSKAFALRAQRVLFCCARKSTIRALAFRTSEFMSFGLSEGRVGIVLHSLLAELRHARSKNPVRRLLGLAAAMHFAIRRGVMFFVLEESIRDRINTLFPRLCVGVQALPHPIALDLFSLRPQRLERGQPLRIGFFGRLAKARGFDDFLAAVSSFPFELRKKVEFYAFGERSDGTRHQLELAGLVKHTHPKTRREYAAGLQKTHLAVLPLEKKFYDWCASGVLLDLLAARTPMVAGRTEAISRLWKTHGELGFLVSEVAALGRGLQEAVEKVTPRLYNAFVKNVDAAARERHPKRLAAKFDDWLG